MEKENYNVMVFSLKINKRNIIINGLIVLLSTFITLLLVEFGMRYFYPRYNPNGNIVFQEMEKGLILAPPNFIGRHWRTSGDFDVSVNINEYGLREKKELTDSDEDDVFVVGDSFSFGHGVEEEERFSNVMQNLFSDSIKVYNIAISSSHILNYQKRLDYVKKNGGQVKKIIVGLCMENDILDYDKVYREWQSRGEQKKSYSFKKWLHHNSCLYNFFAISMKSEGGVRSFLVRTGIIKDVILSYESKKINNLELNSSIIQLQKLIGETESLVVLIPSQLIWVDGHKEITLDNHQRFIELLKANQIQYLDAKTILENHSINPLQTLHFKYDGHWNKNAHKLIAEAIFQKWNEMQISKNKIGFGKMVIEE